MIPGRMQTILVTFHGVLMDETGLELNKNVIAKRENLRRLPRGEEEFRLVRAGNERPQGDSLFHHRVRETQFGK
jgi:hypothetical protein